MIREAQYALKNAGPGSTDERKYIARAKKYALLVVRKHPHSIEATQAREVLAQLDISVASSTPLPLAFQPIVPPAKNSTVDRFAAAVAADDQWQTVMQRFVALPKRKKKLLAWGLVLPIIVLIPFSIFVIFGVALVYALNLPMLKRHLFLLLNSLESGK